MHAPMYRRDPTQNILLQLYYCTCTINLRRHTQKPSNRRDSVCIPTQKFSHIISERVWVPYTRSFYTEQVLHSYCKISPMYSSAFQRSSTLFLCCFSSIYTVFPRSVAAASKTSQLLEGGRIVASEAREVFINTAMVQVTNKLVTPSLLAGQLQ